MHCIYCDCIFLLSSLQPPAESLTYARPWISVDWVNAYIFEIFLPTSKSSVISKNSSFMWQTLFVMNPKQKICWQSSRTGTLSKNYFHFNCVVVWLDSLLCNVWSWKEFQRSWILFWKGNKLHRKIHYKYVCVCVCVCVCMSLFSVCTKYYMICLTDYYLLLFLATFFRNH